MSSSSKQKSWGFYIFRRERIKNSDYKKLLGIEADTNLNFILTHNLVLALWMFHSRILNNKINRLHERCMRLIYGNKATSFGELLKQGKTVSIHIRNLQMLATEMFTVYRNMSTRIFSELFCRRDICYNFRSNSNFAIPNV